MSKTIIDFVVPFALTEEGEYNIKHGEHIVKTTIQLIQDSERFEKITGMRFSSTGNGKMRMIPDVHGIANYSKISIELPYLYNPDSSRDFSEIHPLKIESMEIINRLIEVVRGSTLQSWIRPISPRDISQFNYDRINDEGKSLTAMVMDFGQGYKLPFHNVTQNDKDGEIRHKLVNGSSIPVYENLLLDAMNYFEEGRFNECVIIANISLESLIENHIFQRLCKQGYVEEAKKETSKIFSRANKKKSVLGTILTKEFEKLGKKSLDSSEKLKMKFDMVRKIRKNAIHPKTKRITLDEAEFCINGINEIKDWILKKSD